MVDPKGVRRGGFGGSTPPIGLSTKMHNKENITFFSLLSLFFFALTWTPTWFKATFETFEVSWGMGVNLSKIELTNQWQPQKIAKINKFNR